MKALRSLIAILFSTLLFAGCIEISTLITVNPDGSGTVEETVMLSKEIINMMSELEKSFSSDSTEAKPFEFYNEEDLKNQAAEFGEEVRYVSSTKIDRDNKEGHMVMYEFRDINELKLNQNPNSRVKLESFEDDAEVEKEFITFSFIKGDPSELRIQMPSEKMAPDTEKVEAPVDVAEQDTSMINEQIAQVFKDLRISLMVNVNGSIVNTNAQYVDGSKITLMDVDFGELIENADKMKEFRETDPQNLEQVKEVLKGIPGIKVDINDVLYIKFE